jgi:hypothetical protein
VQEQVVLEAVRMGINLLKPRRIERGGPADDAVHLVPLVEQQLREVRTILTGDSGESGFLPRHYLQYFSKKHTPNPATITISVKLLKINSPKQPK